MPERPSIRADRREITGKKVSVLRRRGVIPANLVAPRSDSVALQVDERAVADLIGTVGHTGLVGLEMPGASEVALIGEVDLDPISLRLRHVAFRKVDLTKPIEVVVPVELVGQSPAAQARDRFVVPLLQEIKVRSLPDSIPHSIRIDISSLDAVGDAVRVSDLAAIPGVQFMEESGQVVVQVEYERAEVVAEAAPTVTAEGEAAAPEAAAGEPEEQEQ